MTGRAPFIPPGCTCTWEDPGGTGFTVRKVNRQCPIHGAYVDVPLPIDVPGLDPDRTDNGGTDGTA